MSGFFKEGPSTAVEYELGLEKRIQGPELEARAEYPASSRYVFMSVVEDGAGVVRKLSEVEAVRPEQTGSGLYVVRFAFLSSAEEDETTSEAYFADGFYQGLLEEGKSLYVSSGEITDAKVTSGYFLNRPRQKSGDNLLLSAKERLDREESVI